MSSLDESESDSPADDSGTDENLPSELDSRADMESVLPDEIVLDELDEEALPRKFGPIHRVNGDNSESKEIAIRDLHQNEYDPRDHLDPNEVAARAETLDKPHGHVDLVVRPIEATIDGSEPIQYEVIKGRRDLAALEKLHRQDSDEFVPCTVRHVDDRTAMLLMLTAHSWQVGFSAVEKARVYAKLITVTYGTDKQPLDAYLDDIRATEKPIKLPSNGHSAVKALAEDLQPSPSVIARRLRLLIIPRQVQTLVTNKELSVRVAATIADGLRTLPDPEVRQDQMCALAADGDSSGADSLADLRNRTAAICEAYQSQQQGTPEEWTDERIEELEETITEHKQALRRTVGKVINYYNGHDLANDELIDSGRNDSMKKATTVAETCSDRYERLYDEWVEPLTEQRGARKRDRTRTEENKMINIEEDRNGCPFCGRAGVHESDLDSRIDRLDGEITDLTERLETVRAERDTFRRKGRQIEDLIEEIEATRSQLARVRGHRGDADNDDESNSDEDDGTDDGSVTSS